MTDKPTSVHESRAVPPVSPYKRSPHEGAPHPYSHGPHEGVPHPRSHGPHERPHHRHGPHESSPSLRPHGPHERQHHHHGPHEGPPHARPRGPHHSHSHGPQDGPHHKHPHGPHHRPPHTPSGLHLIGQRIDEMRRRGAPESAIQEILDSVKDRLPKKVLNSIYRSAPDDLSVTLGQSAEDANQAALDLLRQFSDDGILISGELPPHLICALLDFDVSATQVCDPSRHGHRPPHFRDLEVNYGAFSGVTSLTELPDEGVKVIVIHAFVPDGESAVVCPLALMATRLWPEAKIIAVISDHRAPHHVVTLRRDIDQYLFWE